MTAPVFVDTNIIVYRHDSGEPVKQARAHEWLAFLAGERRARISFQVLQELHATLTRKLHPAFSTQEAREIVRDLAVWEPAEVSFEILERGWLVERRYSISWWDALIVAAAQSCGCGALLSENLRHGQEYGDVRVVNPFADPELSPRETLTALEAQA